MMLAIALLPLMGAVGMATDYGNAVRIRSNLQHALDSAVLAAASAQAQSGTPSQATIQAAVSAYLARDTTLPSPAVSATIDTAGTVTAQASLQVPTNFMRIAGISDLTVAAKSKAGFGSNPVEIALVLDTTGSMAGAKLTGMVQAAQNLVTSVFAVPNSASRVRMSLVPFTYYVNIGTSYRYAAWMTNTTDSSTTSNQCWTTYPNATYTNPVTTSGTCYSDGTPYTCTSTSYTTNLGTPVQQCGPVTYTYTWTGCVGSRNYPADMQDAVSTANPVPGMLNTNCSAPLQRLTSSSSSLNTQIGNLVADGETYIAPGLLWGWRTLSPSLPFGDASPYNSGTSKIMILMTDGANTHSPNYPDHEGTDVATANTLTATTCTNIKATGIVVYTIAFQVTDPTIKNILQSCASGSNFYFDSSTIGSMQSAFANIAASLASAHLME